MEYQNCFLALLVASLLHVESRASAIASSALSQNEKISEEILNTLLSETSYSKIVRPAVTTNVSVNLDVRNINFLDDINMELGTQITIRLRWVDPRLGYENFTTEHKSLLPDYIPISDASTVWYPDIFITNEKKGVIHNILKPNVLLRIHRNGSMVFSTRISLVTGCEMRLNWYPFDKHRCYINFASYSLKSDELNLSWIKPDTVSAPPLGFQLARFTLMEISTEAELGMDYSKTTLYLSFKREFSYYLVNVFTPTIMLVFISWVSFWFDVTALEARVSLGITTILTAATQTFGFNQTAPVVSYTKAIDIFSGISQTFIMLALLEFALVDVTLRKYSSSSSSGKLFPKRDSGFSERTKNCLVDENVVEARFRAKRIDLMSRIIFPVGYFGFLSIYFAICVGY